MRILESLTRRGTRALDALFHRILGWRLNPMHQSGALAAWMLVVLTVTGLYLLLVYRVGDPSGSVQRIADQVWLGAWVRSLHRYATAAFVIAALLHAIRLFGQARTWGTRTRAWVSGVFLLGVGLACAWTGYVMAWDAFGYRLARAGARLFDVLPILSEPVGRIFAGEHTIPSAFFFLNLFIHIALPLAMGAGLWFHVSKVARPVLVPPAKLRWAVTGALTAVALLWPATLDSAADPLRLPEHTSIDLVTSWWLPIIERLDPLWAWLFALAMPALVLLVPWFTRQPRTGALAVSVVDPRHCTGCDQCPKDCPWEAITMVPRSDGRPTLLAQVDPLRCVSCGICAGSCAPMGIGPPGRNGREQLGVIRARDPISWPSPEEREIVVVLCAQAADSLRGAITAAGARVHEVNCVGALHSSVIELLLRQGSAGVLIGGCPPRDCVGREGPKWLEQRLYHDREAELQPRVDRRRVRVTTFALGLDGEALDELASFRTALEALAQSEKQGDLDEAVCERDESAVVGA